VAHRSYPPNTPHLPNDGVRSQCLKAENKSSPDRREGVDCAFSRARSTHKAAVLVAFTFSNKLSDLAALHAALMRPA